MAKGKLVFRDRFSWILIASAGLLVIFGFLFLQWDSQIVRVIFALAGALVVLFMIVNTLGASSAIRMSRNERLLVFALDQIEQLEGKLAEQSPKGTNLDPQHTTERWPWGDHHTEQLGHLSAAARRFWKLYDPSDIGTAPTNKEVAEWLVKERKVSKTMADAIATILRIDGLRTGPRE